MRSLVKAAISLHFGLVQFSKACEDSLWVIGWIPSDFEVCSRSLACPQEYIVRFYSLRLTVEWG